MKIGLVLSKTPAYSETFFISKLKGLQQSGFGVTLFVQQKDLDFNQCPVKVAPKVFKRNVLLQAVYTIKVIIKLCYYPKRLRTFIGLEKKAKRSKIQILKNLYNNAHILTAHLDWLHFGFATMAIQSEHVAKAIGAKMAVSFRGYDIDVYPLKYEGCYLLLLEHVDQVHSISHYLLNRAYTLGLSKTTPFRIIPPAVDSNIIDRNDTGKFHQTLQFLTIARLEWVKGLTYTIEALALLRQNGIKFQYTIIGSGRMRDELLFSIYHLGLSKCVTLLDYIPHEDVYEHLRNAHIYIQYSLSEGFCNAVLEAQAMRCLCVVSDGGALPENVLHEKTGWVVPKESPKALADKIIEVIRLPEKEKKKIRKNARQRAVTEFNLQKQQKEFVEFYTL